MQQTIHTHFKNAIIIYFFIFNPPTNFAFTLVPVTYSNIYVLIPYHIEIATKCSSCLSCTFESYCHIERLGCKLPNIVIRILAILLHITAEIICRSIIQRTYGMRICREVLYFTSSSPPRGNRFFIFRVQHTNIDLIQI